MKTSEKSFGASSHKKDLEEKIKILEKKVRFLELFNEHSYVCEMYRDHEGTLFYMSPSFDLITGHKRDDYLKDPSRLFEIVHPDDVEITRNNFKRINAREPFDELEVRIFNTDGSVKYLTLSSRPVYSDEGTFLGSHTSAVDITRNKKIEMDLIESRAKFKALFDYSNQGIVLVDDQGRIVDWNKRLAEVTGIKPEKAINEYAWTVAFSAIPEEKKKAITPERFKEFWTEKFRELEEKQSYHGSGVLLNVNGEVEYVEDFIRLLTIGEKKYYCSFQDYVTYQKKVEHSLMEHKEKFEKIFRDNPCPIAVIRCKDFTYKDINRSYEVMTGYPREELMGKPASLSTDIPLFIRNCSPDSPDQEKEIRSINLRFRNKSGRHIETLTSYSKILTDNEEHYIEIHSDITHIKEAEAELNNKLEEVSKLNRELEHYAFVNNDLKQFAYTASHQLQEPIRTVRNYVKIFEEDYSQKLDENAGKYMEIILNATGRMSYLINTLLEFSRIGRISKLTKVDCGKIVEDVLAGLNYQITESDAAIEVGKMPVLDLYQTEFYQLMLNLIGNALKFRKKDVSPAISIEAELQEGTYLFSVRDNGIGIDPVHFNRIFEIFQRLHVSEEVYEGKGVGLAYCRKIVNMHGGEIWVESYPGTGSVFYFTIPIT